MTYIVSSETLTQSVSCVLHINVLNIKVVMFLIYGRPM